MTLGRQAGQKRSLFHRFGKFGGPRPLTARSVVLLAALVYLFVWPIRGNADIVSAALAYGLLVVLTLITLLVVGQALSLKKRLGLTVVPPESGLVPNQPTQIVVTTEVLRVLPFTFIDLTLDFEQPGVESTTVRLSGFGSARRRAVAEVTFPHRGAWNISGVLVEAGDVAGLARQSWYVPLSIAPTIYPHEHPDTTLPILSSSQRPGELVVDTLNRQGDPFDIKPYHPADGVKRIIWKAFAKRGELLSRHPEASMTPEGYVVMLVLARPNDDEVCSRAVAYARNIEELKLDLLVGCEGQRGRPCAQDGDKARELLVDSVWDSAHSTIDTLRADANELLDYASSMAASVKISKLLLFCSGDRLADPKEQEILRSLASWLGDRGVAPVFCINAFSEQHALALNGRVSSQVSKWLTVQRSTERTNLSHAEYNAFLSTCLQRQWEVYL